MTISHAAFGDPRRAMALLGTLVVATVVSDLYAFYGGVGFVSLFMGGLLCAICLTLGIGWGGQINLLSRIGLFGIAGFIPITTPAVLMPETIGTHAALFFVLARFPVFALVLGQFGPSILARMGSGDRSDG